jgi:hypothetical protein
MNKQSILLKHSFSKAKDAYTDMEIDEATFTVTIRMQTGRRQQFVSSAHLEYVIFTILLRNDPPIIAYRDETIRLSEDSPWIVIVEMGDIRMRAECYLQQGFGERKVDPVIELYPLPPKDVS